MVCVPEPNQTLTTAVANQPKGSKQKIIFCNDHLWSIDKQRTIFCHLVWTTAKVHVHLHWCPPQTKEHKHWRCSHRWRVSPPSCIMNLSCVWYWTLKGQPVFQPVTYYFGLSSVCQTDFCRSFWSCSSSMLQCRLLLQFWGT